MRGNVPVSLFELTGTRELSVDRLRDDHMVEVSAIAIEHDKRRNRNFYGWATVPQDAASENGRRVEPTPQPDNPYHADIILPIAVSKDDYQRERHATELAACAEWQALATAANPLC